MERSLFMDSVITDHCVLVADSDASLTAVYERYLKSQGLRVFVASDGIACLETLQNVRPDVLVLDSDLLWGGADGVLSHLRDKQTLLATDVILVTDAPPRESAALVVPPVIATLRKPFRLRSLLELLQARESTLSKYQ